ncbi:MAG: hypothetical protein WHV67_10700, partial [Thermoanaerobaculia bacterium]
LLIFSKKRVPEFEIIEFFKDTLKMFVFNIPFFILLYFSSIYLFDNLNQSFHILGIKLLLIIFFTILIYFLLASLFKIKGSQIIKNLFRG